MTLFEHLCVMIKVAYFVRQKGFVGKLLHCSSMKSCESHLTTTTKVKVVSEYEYPHGPTAIHITKQHISEFSSLLRLQKIPPFLPPFLAANCCGQSRSLPPAPSKPQICKILLFKLAWLMISKFIDTMKASDMLNV